MQDKYPTILCPSLPHRSGTKRKFDEASVPPLNAEQGSSSNMPSKAAPFDSSSRRRRTGATVCFSWDNNALVVETVLSAMETNVPSAAVQLNAAILLQRLLSTSCTPDNPKQWMLTAARGISILFRSMQKHADNALIQCCHLDLILQLRESTSTQHQQQANNYWQKTGAVGIIWCALQRHTMVSYVQQLGLALLSWLVEDSAACRCELVALGAMDFLPTIMSMRLHRMDAVVQCNATAALSWLLVPANNNNNNNATTRLDFLQHFPVLLDVLELHQNNARVFGNCVCLLCVFPQQQQQSDQDPTGTAVWLLPRLLRGMAQHEDSAQVQVACLRWMLCNLRAESVSLVSWLTSSSSSSSSVVIRTILQAMRLHPTHCHLLAQATEVLTVLLLLADHHHHAAVWHEALVEQGAADVVLDALRAHGRRDRRLQYYVLWILTVLLAGSEESSTMAFGGGPAVLEIIWQSLGIERGR
jgi:hypothetical protein